MGSHVSVSERRVTRVTVAKLAMVAAVAIFAVHSPAALAAPPANDDRATPTPLSVPQTITGTTVEATSEASEPLSNCWGRGDGTVWYSISGVNRRIALTLVADGDLDAMIEVFERSRSQTTSIDCALTDKKGIGIVAFKAKSSSDYLIRISPRANSVDGTFSLEVATAADDASPPGSHLPISGVTDTVNLARNPSDAWAVRMRAGVSYRINLSSPSGDYCVKAAVYAKGEFENTPKVRMACDRGYALFTPAAGAGGVYTVLVSAARFVLGNQRYHLEVAPAQRDDTSPGVFWPGKSAAGSLSGGGIDVVDIYNFDIRRRSNVELRLSSSADFDVEIRSLSGRWLAGSDDEDGSVSRRLAPGQYYAIVRSSGSSGRYKLRRIEKAVTSTRVKFNGGRHASIDAGGSVRLAAHVSPAVTGKVEITLQRLDPVFGWQFERAYTGSASNGVFSVVFTPPGVGRWRAQAEFKGSRVAVASISGYARLSVGR